MNINVTVKGDTAEVTPMGDLTASTAGLLSEQLTALLEQKTSRILLNLWDVHFIDSTGISALIGAHKQFLSQNGRIVFISPVEAVNKVLKMTGAYQKLAMAFTREEGIKRLLDADN